MCGRTGSEPKAHTVNHSDNSQTVTGPESDLKDC